MKYIKSYEGLFDIFKRKPKDPKYKEVGDICKLLNLTNYTINEDYSVDVDDSVDISCKKDKDNKILKEIPIKFGKVTGNFFCGHNQLSNLKNSPDYVGGRFDCRSQYYSSLRSLEGAPNYVGYDFDCSGNSKIYSLEFSPEVARKLNFSHTAVCILDNISRNISDLDCSNSPISQLYDIIYFKDLQTTIELFNAYDPVDISDNPYKPVIYMDRLKLLCDYIADLDESPRNIYSFDIVNLKEYYKIINN